MLLFSNHFGKLIKSYSFFVKISDSLLPIILAVLFYWIITPWMYERGCLCRYRSGWDSVKFSSWNQMLKTIYYVACSLLSYLLWISSWPEVPRQFIFVCGFLKMWSDLTHPLSPVHTSGRLSPPLNYNYKHQQSRANNVPHVMTPAGKYCFRSSLEFRFQNLYVKNNIFYHIPI